MATMLATVSVGATKATLLMLAAAATAMVVSNLLNQLEEDTANLPQPVSVPATENPLISVNYHFLRQCNYSCKFCFHTDNKSRVLNVTDAKRGLQMLHDAGTKKINFSGGEPFLKASMLGEMCRFAKKELGMSVSIISNGSLIKRQWMEKYGQFVDILGISCDSAIPSTNQRIGRASRSGDHVEQLRQVRQWCREFDIKFKMNTVVCAYNHEENLSALLEDLEPARWKVFQCLAIEGENSGENSTDRAVEELLVTNQQFQAYLDRHKLHHPVHESNSAMRNSYLILDENMCFLNNQDNRKLPTASILAVGVWAALEEAGFDHQMFVRRGGIYSWNRDAAADAVAKCGNEVAVQLSSGCNGTQKCTGDNAMHALLDW